MNKELVLILGARSDIAISVAHRFAKEGYDIQLAGRGLNSFDIYKSDIELRYQVKVSLHEFDALDISSHSKFVDSLPKLPNVIICAVGFMGTQKENEQDLEGAVKVMRSNFEGPASIFGLLANRLEQRGSGTLVGISSVAGERGRAKNYIYGSAKAGFTAFLSGLRNRLAKKGVNVITVLPGYVSTKMTKGMNFPSMLTAKPDEVASALFNAVQKKRNIIYVKKVWWIIMKTIHIIPEKIFKKLKI